MNIYFSIWNPHCSELYHHGIKGQKWGVRRYQYEDRTWTPAGKERYGRDGSHGAGSESDSKSRKAANAIEKRGTALGSKLSKHFITRDVGDDIDYYSRVPNYILDKIHKKKNAEMDRRTAGRAASYAGAAAGALAAKSLASGKAGQLAMYGLDKITEGTKLNDIINSDWFDVGSKYATTFIGSQIGAKLGEKAGTSIYDKATQKKKKQRS